MSGSPIYTRTCKNRNIWLSLRPERNGRDEEDEDCMYHGAKCQRRGADAESRENGMNIARFNFSHGDYEEHKYRMDMLKKIREEEKIPVAILLIKGPEIRTGVLKDGKKVMLEAGQEFTLTSEEIIGIRNGFLSHIRV